MRRKTEREINGIKVFKHNFNKEDIIKPFRCTNGSLYYKDTLWWTNDGYLVKVIEYYDKNNVLIEFLYNGYRKYTRIGDLKYGAIKNPYHLNIYGGYIGEGPYGKEDHLKIYKTWSHMLERHTIEGQMKDKNKSYVNSSICNEWYNYQNFALWYDNYISSLNPLYYNDYQLDKDILQWNQPYKIYSPNTCCIVPKEINICLDGIYTPNKTLPTGVNLRSNGKYSASIRINGKLHYIGFYNTPEEAFLSYINAKKDRLKQLADFYYTKGAIKQIIYEILYNIEILPYGYR